MKQIAKILALPVILALLVGCAPLQPIGEMEMDNAGSTTVRLA